MTWFLLKNEEICGPFEASYIRENCDDRCLIWGPGMEVWSDKATWQELLSRPKEEPEVLAEVFSIKPVNTKNKSVEEIAELALTQLNDEWYFSYNNQKFGPFNQNHLVLKVSSLEKPEEVLLWKKGEDSWRPLFEFPRFLNALNEKIDQKAAA